MQTLKRIAIEAGPETIAQISLAIQEGRRRNLISGNYFVQYQTVTHQVAYTTRGRDVRPS